MKIFRPTADNTPTDFLNPLGEDRNEAKGEIRGEAPFVEQNRQQFEKIKQNETDQIRFQQKKLQNSNYQVVNYQIQPTSDATSQSYYVEDFNQATAVGSPMTDGIMFGQNPPTATIEVSEAKYYNIVYVNVRWYDSFFAGTSQLLSPSYVDFYLMQKIAGGGNTLGGKIPRQIDAVVSGTTVGGMTGDGTEFGVQSFGVDVFNEHAYYTQSPDLKGMRTIGLGLKSVVLNLGSARPLNTILLNVEIGIDLNTEGNNY
jgi:hypothetical protein